MTGFVNVLCVTKPPSKASHICPRNPSARGASDDLASLAGHEYTSGYERHTFGTLSRLSDLFIGS
jgi:hypothetical protein